MSHHEKNNQNKDNRYCAQTEKIKNDFAPLKDDVTNLAQKVKADAMEAGEQLATNAKKKINDKMDDLDAQASSYMECLGKDVSKNPVQAVAIAFAAGAVFSMFLGRR